MIRVRDYTAYVSTRTDVVTPTGEIVGRYSFWSQPAFDFDLNAGDRLRVAGYTDYKGQHCKLVQLPGKPFAALLVSDDGEPIYPTAGFIGGHWTEATAKVAFVERGRLVPTTETRVVRDRPFENFELIFTGISNDAVTISYREFTPDDLARPAFYQNLSYSRAPNQTIRFRKLRILLLSASDESIRFKVLED